MKFTVTRDFLFLQIIWKKKAGIHSRCIANILTELSTAFAFATVIWLYTLQGRRNWGCQGCTCTPYFWYKGTKSTLNFRLFAWLLRVVHPLILAACYGPDNTLHCDKGICRADVREQTVTIRHYEKQNKKLILVSKTCIMN